MQQPRRRRDLTEWPTTCIPAGRGIASFRTFARLNFKSMYLRTRRSTGVVKNILSIGCFGLFLVGLTAPLSAAPRLSLSQTAFTVTTVPGSNGPAQNVEAANLGDGSLNLQVSSNVTWLVPTVGASHNCGTGTGTCITVQIALQTASLAKGTFTGKVTITDPNAIDAPQFVTVTV